MKKPDRCPVCGRYPKIKTYNANYARVQCKPWYCRKPHERVFVEIFDGDRKPGALIDTAIDSWNERVNCAKLPVW